MTAGFQTELRARAAEYASEWRPSVADEDEAAALLTEVKSRRRGRGLAAGASALGLAVVVGLSVMFGGGGGPVLNRNTGDASQLAVLGSIGPSDAVLAVLDRNARDASSGYDDEEIVIVHANASAVERISGAQVRQALGSEVDTWPGIWLVALQPELSRAVFLLENPVAYLPPRVAVHEWATGTTVVVDPCNSPLSSIDLSPWCADGGGEVLPGFAKCVTSGVRIGQIVSRTCVDDEGQNTLVLQDLGSGDTRKWGLGMGPLEPPLVLDFLVFANSRTVGGAVVLVTSGGVQVDVGDAPVQGLAVMAGRLLVVTSSDESGPPSSYGRVLGLYAPNSGQFEELPQVPLGEGATVRAVWVVG